MPVPDAGMPLPAIPSTPLPDAPLPEAPLPTGPQPNGLDAPAVNPFGGSSSNRAPSRFDDDPPPALPPSLQSTRRVRDARRTAEQRGDRGQIARGMTRLPITGSAPQGTQGRYDVQQASATVWASGTDDIRSADPNAGRIEQAIHHEPIE
jgi:hypothetical protein